MYSHNSCIKDFYQCLESVGTTNFRLELENAPYGMFGIEADEVTDSSNESIIVVYIR